MKTIELHITETARKSTHQSEAATFNAIHKTFHNMEQLTTFLKLRYGRIPNGRNKIYRDTDVKTADVVGFTYSYWEQDWSHNSVKWFQTDWIEIYEQETIRKYNIKLK